MSQVLGMLPTGNIFTIVFFDDGLVIDRQAPLVGAGYAFGAIGAAITSGARAKHRKKLEATANEIGVQGPAAVAAAMKRAQAVTYDAVASVRLTNKGKWTRVATLTRGDGSTVSFRYSDRRSTSTPQVASWLAHAPGFSAEPAPG